MGLQATNAGIDFQQRVSAFMMILMEFGIDVSKVLEINNADEKIVRYVNNLFLNMKKIEHLIWHIY